MMVDTWGDRPWSAEVTNITHTLRVSMKAEDNCGDTYDIFNSFLDYQDFTLDMTGLDR